MKSILTFTVLSLALSYAQAQIRCEPVQGKKNEFSCGDRTQSFAKDDQKVEGVTVLAKDPTRGAEQKIILRKVNMPLGKVQSPEFLKSVMVQSEVKKATVGWDARSTTLEVFALEFAPKSTFYTASNMKTKIDAGKLMLAPKRGIASDNHNSVGGVRQPVK